MKPAFDLTIENWIPIVKNDLLSEINLKELLLSAHKISRISDFMPVTEFGLYRFLTALVMDIWEFRDINHLKELIDAGQFDLAKINGYFNRHHDWFDLFDDKQPFLQVSHTQNLLEKPISGLLPNIPSGTSVNHFHHFSESDFGVSPAVAAKLLTTIAPFMTAGGAGLSPSINGAPPWYVLINGESLFHTICLNCYVGLTGLSGDAPPVWRNPLPPRRDGRCTETSILEALTWRPRQIRLIPGESGICSISGKQSSILIRTMRYGGGASCGFTWMDPSVSYKKTSAGSSAIRPQANKEIWRDTAALSLMHDDAELINNEVRFSRPLSIEQYQQLTKDLHICRDNSLSLTIYGMRTDMKTKVFEWRKEMLSVPLPLIAERKLSRVVQESIADADKAETALIKVLKHLCPKEKVSNSKVSDTNIANAAREYWSELRSWYEILLNELAALEDQTERLSLIRDKWQVNIRMVAMQVFKGASDNLDTYGDSIQRLVEAQLNLGRTLSYLFDTPEQIEKQVRIRRIHSSSEEKKTKLLADSFRNTVINEHYECPDENDTGFINELVNLDQNRITILRHNAGRSIEDAKGVLWFNNMSAEYDRYGGNQAAYFLVAVLFAHDKHFHVTDNKTNCNFGATLRVFRFSSGMRLPERCPMDRRFNTLLDADFDPGRGGELAFRLIQMVKLLFSADTPSVCINWAQLLHDVKLWNHEKRVIQKSWTRSYYLSLLDTL
ncbi:MAG: type I-E CRISPR-associated protein Cse1/CasA [Armatimonadota bacterium]